MRNAILMWTAMGSVTLLAGCATIGAGSKADKRFARGEYEAALTLYKADVARGKNVASTNYSIAEAYRLSNRIEQAETYYRAAIDGGARKADAGYYYGLALRANGKFEEAAQQFSKYAEAGSNRTLTAQAEAEAKSALASKDLAARLTNNEVLPLDELNTPASEFGTTRIADTRELVFASGREGKPFPGNGEGFNDLYAVRFADDQNFTGATVRKLEPVINSANRHEASATYSPDGKTLVFARSNDGSKKGLLSVDLWISYYREGAWTEPDILRGVNSSIADEYSPVFSTDGQTLYFASTRKGGFGGSDLYKATMEGPGRFSAPENLGDKINTVGNESFPALSPEGVLYFSSDGHPGLGKLDIFKFDKGQVQNLGLPINSNGDDFAPYFLDKQGGIFSSNRAGGKGSDDLYRFRENPTKLVFFVADGIVMERSSQTGTTTSVPNQSVTLFGANGQQLQSTTSGPDGKFVFKLDSAAVTYALTANRDGFFTARSSLTTVGRKPAQANLPDLVNEIRLPVVLTLTKIVKNKAIIVENIFYDYDKANIRPDAALELDKLVETLNDNPRITIELSSHTDSRGKDAYNQALSQRRAQSAVDYIISRGIAAGRITAKGYGESRPVVPNAKTEEQYQRNRRTEFKVTKIAQ